MKKFNVLGIIGGIGLIVLGLVLAFGYNGPTFVGTSDPSYARFGGDYYTEQYAVTRTAALNIIGFGRSAFQFMQFAAMIGGLIVSVFGGVVVCYFGGRLCTEKNAAASMQPITVKEETPQDLSSELPEL